MNNTIISFFGGAFFQKGDIFENATKAAVLLLFLGVSSLSIFSPNLFWQLISGVIAAIIVFIIKILMITFNKLIDNGVYAEEDPIPVEETTIESFTLPPGISKQLWDHRAILFDSNVDMNERAFRLISDGYDPEEIFALAALITSGEVTPNTRIREAPEVTRQILINCCGKSRKLPFTRKSLSRTFDRPHGIIEIIVSVILAFGSVVLLRYVSNNLAFQIPLVFSSMLALSSLVHAPSVDNYCTSLNDIFIRYTRTFSIVLITALIIGFSELLKLTRNSTLYNIIDFVIMFCQSVVSYMPIYIVLGPIGHPISTIHYMIEVIDSYAFGFCGTESLLSAVVNLVIGCVHVCIMVLFEYIKNRNLVVALRVTYAVFSCFVYYTKYSVKSIIYGIILTLVGAGSAFLAVYCFKDVTLLILIFPSVIFITDYVFPYLSSNQQYILLYMRLLKINKYVMHCRPIIRTIIIPIILVIVLAQNSFTNYISLEFATEVISTGALYRLCMSEPSTGVLALLFLAYTLNFEYKIGGYSICLFFSVLAAKKCFSMYRILVTKSREGIFASGTLQSPITFSALCFNIFDVYFGNYMNYPSLIGVLWGLITGMPMKIIGGQPKLQWWAPLIPTVFYESSSLDVPCGDHGHVHVDSSHIFEIPVYSSLLGALEKRLASEIAEGRLGNVVSDSFYILLNDDLISIFQVISSGPFGVTFQLRGLEYQQTTICHVGELSILQQMTMPSAGVDVSKSLAFRFTSWQHRANVSLDMLGLSQISFSGVHSASASKSEQYAMAASAYIATQSSFEVPEEVEIPDGIAELCNAFHSAFASESNSDQSEVMRASEIFAALKEPKDDTNDESLSRLFNAEFPNTAHIQEKAEAAQLYVVMMLMDSVGVGPEEGDGAALAEFVSECLETRTFSRTGSAATLERLDAKPVVMMHAPNGEPIIIRFGFGENEWCCIQMNEGIVKGLWMNEASSILFQAINLKERGSIQLEPFILRNVTNSSCNQPIGYPVFVSSISSSSFVPFMN